ncbi:HypC/HybG/HupF family hydrogenase formation chaperone [Rhodobium gokarnense]|uniref:Hydrogenase expression/formation protein HypC n=1 Tax=Rhodobium gokarnense TaxID=364296 RepID=A0ABT3HIP0_9HYPH|nr:HypC/HybG/HupF family hydrogenase formation chaperone [Rhodobium gokarnense]MCW2310126.1 hydrogenase expression/formation protein HypC [Rhodobium gokarnense]
MCLAVPARVLSVDGATAVVERYGAELTVSLAMLPEPVAAGDFVVLQMQRFAVAKMDAETAAESYRLFDDILEAIGERERPQ